MIKDRSIHEIHRVWLKLKDRSHKRWMLMGDQIDKIIRDIPVNLKDNKHHVYYRLPIQDDQDVVLMYIIDPIRGAFSGGNYLDPNTREGKIASAIDGGIQHQYGEEINYIYKCMQSTWDGKLFRFLWEKIEEKLREMVSYDDFEEPKKALIIDIDGHTYIVTASVDSYRWINFTWQGKTNEPILL
jgi:hypothetical protein